ncbi:MAG: DUF1329 domain-containing protein [Stagnimonas sp.]|nr:DUF1329 domain-containing protein [Stagnimonas sp.]
MTLAPSHLTPAVAGLALLLASGVAAAKVSEAKAAELDGPRYTCIGAERAGSPSGIPAYTGKFQGTWPGVKNPYGFDPGPYADEKPQFSITAENMAKYADRLTEGQKALFAKYPKSYRMDVYPSHRDFRDSDAICQRTKHNAVTSEVIDQGKGVTGTGGAIPFPFPQSGLEAVWNAGNSGRTWTQSAVCDIAGVYANGSIAWGRNKFQVLTLNNDPAKPALYTDRINSHFYSGYLLPPRDKGFVAVGYQPNNFAKEGTASWQYLPGIRRVRQAPEVGFDYPVPPAGLRTVDDDYGFNGSPERYTWKLVGKREYYVPYNNFRINDPAVKYSSLIKPDTVNPDYVRYELHRVWVVEGTLKPGLRHIYGRRVLFADEDSWLVLTADNYDVRKQIWRQSLITYFYSQESQSWNRGASIYHDLTAGVYEAGYLVNESESWWRLNTPMAPAQFTPTAAQQGGH